MVSRRHHRRTAAARKEAVRLVKGMRRVIPQDDTWIARRNDKPVASSFSQKPPRTEILCASAFNEDQVEDEDCEESVRPSSSAREDGMI